MSSYLNLIFKSYLIHYQNKPLIDTILIILPGFDTYNIHQQPYDASGHGTQTMGIIVGGNYGGTSIGVAPEAKWVGVKIFDDRGEARLSNIHQAFAWLLDPDGNPDTDDIPDIVNNSWGFNYVNQCDNEFQEDIELLKNVDVAVGFSAGNSGPYLSSSESRK